MKLRKNPELAEAVLDKASDLVKGKKKKSKEKA
jgi:hypothetical protein